jgi:glutaredoxin-like protein NrdH
MVSATIYTRNNCTACTATKTMFQRLGVRYTEVNVEENPDVAEQLVQDGWRAMPVVIGIDGSEWSGFRPAKIEAQTKV